MSPEARTISRSGAQLAEAVNDLDGARAFAALAVYAEDYAKRLRILADMIDSASVRLQPAMCAREDMQTLLELARRRYPSCIQDCYSSSETTPVLIL